MKDFPRSAYRVTAPVRNLTQRFLYLGLAVVAFAIMLLGKADVLLMERFRAQVTDTVAPILDVLSRPVDAAIQVVDQFNELANLRADNQRLREDRVRLLQWQAVARRLEAENNSLRDILNFVPGPQASFVTARVIADSGNAFAHSLLLNAGERDGVSKGQAVITGDGLVGRINSVGARSARLLLITDLNSRIPVVVESTRTRAILAGDNNYRPRLIHLPPGAAVSPGDRVVTSGHGGAFPPGLPVGAVASVSDAAIVVQPFAGRDRLEYVRIVDFELKGILKLPAAGKDGNKGR